jgi:hypothetical protein
MDDAVTHDGTQYCIALRGSVGLDAWRGLVAGDPDLEEVGYITGIFANSGELFRIERPHSARWLSGPEELGVIFIYGKRGRVHVGVHDSDSGTSTALRSLDPRIMQKMQELADRLGAEVEVIELLPDPDDEDSDDASA